ncbi:MAG: pentapeptide repeat-containing protein [Bacteroidales bacterium]|nr:pentapeptide repeat-containing protein [Candidatus Colimorpha pelethequi]
MDEKIFKGQRLENKDFSGKILDGYDFSETELVSCNFDKADIRSSSFKKATVSGCRFRGAKLSWTDFRYATIENGTFEDAAIENCDFYRTFFDGIILFNHSQVRNCSLNKTYFGDSAFIKRENIVDGRLIQQDLKAWRIFLVEWHNHCLCERTNDSNTQSAWSPDEALSHRWGEAEEIYKNFNALWTGRGFISDGNWAYVKGRKMECRRMIAELFDDSVPFKRKMKNVWHIFTNSMSDLLFGYGESMTKMVVTYVVTVFLFAWLFCSNVSLLEYGEALAVSLKNMAGMDSEVICNVSPFVDMLNVVQTTIGIILTGIFGFILGNKIRNQ